MSAKKLFDASENVYFYFTLYFTFNNNPSAVTYFIPNWCIKYETRDVLKIVLKFWQIWA